MGVLGDLISGKTRRAEEELQLHKNAAQAAREKEAFNEQLRLLEVDRKMRPLLDEAYQRFGGNPNDPTNPGDQKQLGATIEDLFKAYQIETRKPVSPDLVKAFKDPKFGADALKFSTDKGVTLGEMVQGGASPLLRAQGRLAIAKHLDSATATSAANAGDQPAPTMAQAAQANAAPAAPALGSGLQMAGGPPAAPIITAPAAPVAAGGEGQPAAPAPAAAQVPPAANAPAAPAALPKALTPELQGAATLLQDRVANLKKNIGIINSKDPNSKALPILNDQLKTAQEHLFKITAGSAQGQAEAEAQTGRSIVQPQVLRETGLPAGTLQRDIPKGAQMLTPEQSAGIQHSATAAGTELTDVIHQGNVARQTVPMLDVAIAASTRAGITGPLVTPVREAVMKIGNLFGVVTPGQTALQLIDAITPRLAVQLTSQMKGQQSDREFLAGIQSAANKGQTNQAFAMVAYFTRELGALAIEKERQARIWTANREHPGLNIPDKQGRTFQEVFDASVEKVNSDRGTIGERAASAFNVPYKDVLKGNIAPVKRGR